jgi:hypothetical protein
MKIIPNSTIKSSKDLAQHKQILQSYITTEEKRTLGKLPALSNPIVLKLAGIAGAFLLKSLLKRVLK